MTTGIVGDIHQDAEALRRTLDGPLRECSRIVALGDFLDRGPDDASEVLALLAARDAVLVVGNHELAYLGGPSFPGMVESRNVAMGGELRSLAEAGRLVAAYAIAGVLCVHGGVSEAFWSRYLNDACGNDPALIADHLNTRLTDGIARGFRRYPEFRLGSARSPCGPIWANAQQDLLDHRQLPPIRQVVGHVAFSDVRWHTHGAGELFPVLWTNPPDGCLGHVVLDEHAPTT